ncbi:MAG: leucine-rich repeat domain-containing protein [Escherichia coli]|nr:leucine-rich repeat domain-containing protein [Escherichia coli]
MKRLLLLSVMFCIGVLQGFAQDYFTYTDENGVNWECYLGSTGITLPDGTWKDSTYVNIYSASNYGDDVTVPEIITYNGKSYTVAELGSVFSNNQTLKKVTLPKSSISLNHTFYKCTLLSEIVNTEQIKRCENLTFSNCSSLKSIDLSNCESLGCGDFEDCKNLQSVNLRKCTYIDSYAFRGCSSLQSVGDISNCTTIREEAFHFCSSLKSIDISSCNSLEDRLFAVCSKLEEVKLSKQLAKIGSNVFDGCSNLKSIDLSYCTSIGEYAFNECRSMTVVGSIASFSSIQRYAFNNCVNLSDIDLSNCTFVGENAFYNCAKLSSINLSKCKLFETNAFAYCEGLREVDLSSCSSLAEGFFKGCSNLKTIKGIENFTTIPAYAFEGTGIETLSLPLCTTIQKAAFKECMQLKSVNLPKCETIEGYKPEYDGAEGAFLGCNKLQEVDLPSCINIEKYAFYSCPKLSSINIPVCQAIGEEVFAYCGNLNEVSLPNTIQKLGYKCFNGNTSLTLYAKNVPALDRYPGNMAESDTLALGKNVLIIVPEESLAAYQAADVWNTMSERIFPMGTQFEYNVEANAQASTSGLQKAIGEKNLRSVVTLKVKGSINSYDIMVMRNKMDNLHYLDLADADVKSNTYDYYTGYSTQDDILGPHSFADLDKLMTVKLPKSVKYINQAFNNCSQLRSVEMPENLICVGDTTDNEWGMIVGGAFVNCTNLEEIIFHNCEKIGGNAFYQCNSLQEITLPKNLKHVGSSAFNQCSQLKDIILPNEVETISYHAFEACYNLASIQFPPSLKRIEANAFSSCGKLSSINLPGLTSISESTFSGCSNLTEVKLPSTLERIGDRAFEGCSNLTKVYTYTVLPINIDQNTFTNFKATTLYVPTQSYDNYYWSTQWGQFKEIKEFDEPYTYIYLDNEFTLEKRFEGTPDIDIKNNGALTVNGKDNQNAGEVTVKGDGNSSAGTLITDGNLDAKKLRFDITVNANQWYFFSFPFDINLADIKTPGKYVFRKYNGSLRADQGTGGWVDLASDETTLKQGVGYIFQTAQGGNLTLRVTKEKFGKLDANNIVKDLSSYPSADEQNASWNFIGNPQISYMDAASLGYDAPITYWNGNSYEAVRPGDDEFALQPFQAFFIQKPVDVSNIEFKAEDRITKSESINKQNNARARRIGRGINPERLLINLTLSDGNHTDKTRVVFNDKKSQAYELDCDAAKFAAINDAPQFYTIEAKAGNLAINERPMGSVKLGFAAKKAGNFTISAKRMDQPMLLQDNQTGATYDLTEGDYQFASNAGTFENRFVLVPSRGTTGIADIVKKTGINIMPTDAGINLNGVNGKKVTIYAADGTMLASRTSDGMLNLMKGVYIVKIDNLSTKVMVK